MKTYTQINKIVFYLATILLGLPPLQLSAQLIGPAIRKMMSEQPKQSRLVSSVFPLPVKLKQLIDSNNALEARLYTYNNNNFSFPIYGVKMTTSYNSRVSNGTPQNMTIYLLGDNDAVAMLIGETFNRAYIYHSRNSEGYDVYYAYFNNETFSKHRLLIGNGNNKKKVFIISEETTSSGREKVTRCEWTTDQSLSRNPNGSPNSVGTYSPPVNNQTNYPSSSTTSTRRTCPACHGTGKGTDRKVYQPDYTGRQADVYCSICGTTGAPHTHNAPMCRTCYGRGYIE